MMYIVPMIKLVKREGFLVGNFYFVIKSGWTKNKKKIYTIYDVYIETLYNKY